MKVKRFDLWSLILYLLHFLSGLCDPWGIDDGSDYFCYRRVTICRSRMVTWKCFYWDSLAASISKFSGLIKSSEWNYDSAHRRAEVYLILLIISSTSHHPFANSSATITSLVTRISARVGVSFVLWGWSICCEWWDSHGIILRWSRDIFRILRTILSKAWVLNMPYRDGRQAAMSPTPTSTIHQ